MRLILVIQLIFFYTCFSSLENCSSTEVEELKPSKLNTDDLVLNEKLFLMLLGNEEDKEKAISDLKSECNSSKNNSVQACYNLASYLFGQKKFAEGIEFSARSTKLSPKDELYAELNRQFHVQLNRKIQTEENYFNEFILLESACKRKDYSDAKKYFKSLVEQKKIYKENLKIGFIKDCFDENFLVEESKNLISKKMSYTKVYESEKNNSHPFRNVWDFEENPKKTLTKSWKNFRKAISNKDESLSLKYLSEFLEELENLAKKDVENEKFYSQLKLASKLLVEQDKFYTKFPNLKNQFMK